MAGLVGWFKADTLPVNQTSVSIWRNSAPASPGLSLCGPAMQNLTTKAPKRVAARINGLPAVSFDGHSSYLSGSCNVSGSKTIIAVVESGNHADRCCSGVVTTWGADPEGSAGASTNGIALKRTGSVAGGVAAVLDFAGENNCGIVPMAGVPRILAAKFDDAHTASGVLFADSCPDVVEPRGGLGHPSTHFALGWRASDPSHGAGRYLDGLVAEVLIYDRALLASDLQQTTDYLAARFAVNVSQCKLANNASLMATARLALDTPIDIHFMANVSDPHDAHDVRDTTPAEAFAKAVNRTDMLGRRVATSTPDAHLDVGVSVASAAIDGLFRQAPPVFLHGAMAWDVALVGWRSEYGGTLWGWEEEVAAEGRYWFAKQVQTTGANVHCKADPGRLLTVQAPDSRFYGKGRIKGGGMYDMQSQMFDQQVRVHGNNNKKINHLIRPSKKIIRFFPFSDY